MKEKPTNHLVDLTINGYHITTVLIGRHYLLKHSSYMNDALILDLVGALDGRTFPLDSTTDGIDYYVADVEVEPDAKAYRLIWLFEGESLEVLGVINAYRRSKKKEDADETTKKPSGATDSGSD